MKRRKLRQPQERPQRSPQQLSRGDHGERRKVLRMQTSKAASRTRRGFEHSREYSSTPAERQRRAKAEPTDSDDSSSTDESGSDGAVAPAPKLSRRAARAARKAKSRGV